MGSKAMNHPDATIIAAARLFQGLGSQLKTAQALGISTTTMHEWIHDTGRIGELWRETLQMVRTECIIETDRTMSIIIAKAYAAVLERLENGDTKVLGTGELVRCPVSAKDASWIASITFDKRQVLRNLPTQITTSAEHLSKIADKLASMARGAQLRVIEHEAVPEQGAQGTVQVADAVQGGEGGN